MATGTAEVTVLLTEAAAAACGDEKTAAECEDATDGKKAAVFPRWIPGGGMTAAATRASKTRSKRV